MFGFSVDQRLLALTRFNLDREICGYINSVGEVVIVPNIAADPSQEWEMPPGAMPDNAQGVWHSHPRGPACPSGEDMRFQIASDLPHGIATPDAVFWFGDGVPPAPLVGRPFRHGVTDCYELVRDAFQLAGAALPPVARDWSWWKARKSLYTEGFKPAGFVEIAARDAVPGDCVLMTLPGSNVPNHAALWLGGGLILHHVSSRFPYDPTRLSCVEDYGRFGRFLHKAVRYENGYIDRAAFEEIRNVAAAGHSVTG